MLDILDIQPHHRVADFTCGAGGFLVNSARGMDVWYSDRGMHVGPKQLVGVDVSADWARIAAANATLHLLMPLQLQIVVDDAFHAYSSAGNLKNAELFDRIAMAPSFGRSINKSLAQEVLGIKNSSASEVLFPLLAQAKLQSGGKAVVMIPAGLLSKRNGTILRQKLITEKTLEAVITLKAGMLQPFNNERVALLLMRDSAENVPLDQCWFFSVEHDGYPLNLSRDLLQPPPLQQNDLSVVQGCLSLKLDLENFRGIFP